MPALSIIIPVFNSENYLAECINSILAQSFTDFELLLINDGSTDLSGVICDEYVNQYSNIYVWHKSNAGVSSARNKGIEHAKGDYIIFVDSDDWLENDALTVLMSHDFFADLIFYGSNFRLSNDRTVTYSPDKSIYSNFSNVQKGMFNLITNQKHLDYLGFTWNKIFKTEIIHTHNIRFIDNLSLREDEIFTLHYALFCHKLVVLPNLIYNYRILETGLTRKNHTKTEYLLLSHAYQKCLLSYNYKKLQEYIATQIARNYLNAIKVEYDLKNRNMIIEELWMFYHKGRGDIKLQLKSVYRNLLSLSSPYCMKVYMNIKMLFK